MIYAAVLACCAYLAGILWQVFNQPGGAFTGAAPMMSFNIFYCIITGVTKGLALFAVLAVALVILVHRLLKGRLTGDENTDNRNVEFSEKGTYGTAKWMTINEMRELFRVTKKIPRDCGTIYGTRNDEIVSANENPRFNKNIAVYGASGSGKSSNLSIHQCFSIANRGESVILTDPKGELFYHTSEYFRDRGYAVKCLNLARPWHSDGWDCLGEIGTDPLMAQSFVDVIMNNTNNGKKGGDMFWQNGEANLLKALALFVKLNKDMPESDKRMSTVYDLALKGSSVLNTMFRSIDRSHPAYAPYSLFQQGNDQIQLSIVSGLGTRLQIFQNEAIRELTNHAELNLTLPARKKCAYFVIISDQESTMTFMASLFFSFLFIKLIKYADSRPSMKCDIPVNLLLEELPAVGSILDFHKKIAVTRSRGLNITAYFQSIGQLENRYPDNEWSDIISNCDTQVVMGVNDPKTALFVSKRAGESSVDVQTVSTMKKTITPVQLVPEYRETEGIGRRMLLTESEVQRLPINECLVILRGHQVLKLDKFFYKRHPESRKLRPVLQNEYIPDWVKNNQRFLTLMRYQDEEIERELNKYDADNDDAQGDNPEPAAQPLQAPEVFDAPQKTAVAVSPDGTENPFLYDYDDPDDDNIVFRELEGDDL